MPKMQMLSLHVHLGGDRKNTVVRGADEAVSYAEMIVLRAIHGGEDEVHTLIETDRKEVDFAEERTRLRLIYGKIVDEIFGNEAMGGGKLPVGDDTLPTLDDVRAADAAAAKVLAERKAKSNAKPKAPKPTPTPTPIEPETPETEDAPDAPTVPDLADLPE